MSALISQSSVINGETDVTNVEVEATNPTPNQVEGDHTLRENTTPSLDTDDGAIMLSLDSIKRDDDYIVRKKLDPKGVQDYTGLFKDYREALECNEKPKYPFPPIVVWFVNGLYILLCGHHRFEAALKAGLTQILAKVFEGTPDEAYMVAYRDNVKNGVRMTDNDKQVALIKAIKRFADKSLGFLHKELGNSKSTLSGLRNKLYNSGELKRPDGIVGEDGKTYRAKQQGTKKESTVSKAKPQINDAATKGNVQPRGYGEWVSDAIKGLDGVPKPPTAKEHDDYLWKVRNWLRRQGKINRSIHARESYQAKHAVCVEQVTDVPVNIKEAHHDTGATDQPAKAS